MFLIQKAADSWFGYILGSIVEWTPRWLRWAIAIFALIAPFFFFRYGYIIKDFVKVRYSHYQTAEAETLLSDKNCERDAVKMLLQAWVRTPEDRVVIRALARASSRVGLPHYARHFYQLLATHGPITAEDQLDLASALTRLSDPLSASMILDDIQRAHGETIDLWRSRATLATSIGNTAAAHDALQRILALAPEDSTARIALASDLLLSSKDDEKACGITALLDQLEKALQINDYEARNHCFWTLESMSLRDPVQKTRFARLIQRMPWHVIERRVVFHLLGYPHPIQDRNRLELRAWIHRLLETEPQIDSQERLGIARILQHHNEHLLALSVIPAELSLKDRDLLTARIDSLMAEKKWEQIQGLIVAPNVPLSRHHQALFQAWLALETTGDSAESVKKLGIALVEARERQEQGAFVAIGRLAAHHRQHRIASEAYALAFHPLFPVATHLVGPLLLQSRLGGMRADEALHLLAARERIEPWNRDLHRQLSCLRLLSGECIESILAEAEAALRLNPADVYSAFLAAFASQRLGRPDKAATYLEQLRYPYSWQPHERAAMIYILKSCGERGLAAQMAATIPSGAALFEEELSLLRAR